jgi:hypothetical protein
MDNVPSIIVPASPRHRGSVVVRAWTLRACAGFCALWAVQAIAQRSVDQVRQIIEATIAPEPPEKLEGLTGAEVTVTIDAGAAVK